MRDKNFIKSLGKGIAMLELLGEAVEPLSLTDIARRLDTSKTTAQRFIHTLMELGYVRRVSGKRYVLGNRVLGLANRFLHGQGVLNLARPYLEELAAGLGRSVSMGVLDGGQVLVTFRQEHTRPYPLAVYMGSRLPIHCSALGKTLLASLPRKRLEELLDGVDLVKVTPRSKTAKSAVIKETAATRTRGYAITDQELSLDLITYGVPLLDHDGKVAAAAALSLSMSDKENPKATKAALARLIKAGERISRDMGYRGPYPRILSAG
ncbi:MAG: IclR family transcriptional regulator [Desulfarculaceae bacterium]|nr:IclR family transcriptional regulator [Desulfarculaceae bacterium]MCF8071144.1 IclR family transcriptional regulator [Desulfarculaceae bacterium]MCF8101253.1 IclR family transcriptional regulator [Desulfarculaceae bacterium]MCF8115198.1 IclR family transcriptional regulator [Desulfarculaceae bacterium]